MPNTGTPRRVLRRIGAILAGLIAVVVLSTATDVVMHTTGVFPPSGRPMSNALFLLATAYRIVYGIVGGYIAARLAPDRSMAHALALGVVGLAVSVAGAVATWNAGPELGPDGVRSHSSSSRFPPAWAGGQLRESATR